MLGEGEGEGHDLKLKLNQSPQEFNLFPCVISAAWTVASVTASWPLLKRGEYEYIQDVYWFGVKIVNSPSSQIFTTVEYFGSSVVVTSFCCSAMSRKFTQSTRAVLAHIQQKRRERAYSTMSYLQHLVTPASWWKKRLSGPTESFPSPSSSQSATSVGSFTPASKENAAGQEDLSRTFCQTCSVTQSRRPHSRLPEIKEIANSDITN